MSSSQPDSHGARSTGKIETSSVASPRLRAEDYRMPWIQQKLRPTAAAVVAFALVVSFTRCLAAEQDKDVPAKPASKSAAVTPEQCRDWAQAFQRAIPREDMPSINRLVDWNALIEKATAWPNPTATVRNNREQFILGVKDILESGQGMLGELLKALKPGATFRFLGCREIAGSRQAEFRMLATKGVSYHSFRLANYADGSVRAVDWYVFLVGQWQSETLRQTFLPLANTWAKGGAHLIAPAEREFVTHMNDIGAMTEAYGKKDYRQILDIYRGLPDSVKKNRLAFMLRLGAAQAVGGDEQRSAIDDYRQFYPDDAAVDLLMLDDLLAKKSFDKALAGVERIDKAVGGDPHLKVIRARVFLKQGKLKDAQKMAEAAAAEEPTLKSAYYFLVDLALKERNFAKTAELLSILESKCHVTFKDLTTVRAYAEFVKSPEYKAWLKSHGKGV
jgi:hypothetical protein